MRFSVYQESKKGGRRVNQDRMGYLYTRDSLLMVVADGMGGHVRGEVAAQLTMQTVAAIYQRDAKPLIRIRRGSSRNRFSRRTANCTAIAPSTACRRPAHDYRGLHRATGRRDLGARRRFAALRDPRRSHPRTHDRPSRVDHLFNPG